MKELVRKLVVSCAVSPFFRVLLLILGIYAIVFAVHFDKSAWWNVLGGIFIGLYVGLTDLKINLLGWWPNK